MPIEITPRLAERIKNAYFAWLTTVRADGMPQPTPVWYIWDKDTILLYTIPTSQKVKNIKHNNKVSLSFNVDHEGEEFFVLMGEATIDEKTPGPADNAAYLEKYAKGIVDIKMTVESFTKMFSLPIRIRLTHACDQ
jgi:PPOX class probable F420-dependent enzyme